MIGKEEEWRAGHPLLAHKQERRCRRTQQQGRGRAISGRVDLMMQALAQGPVADLIVVLQTVHKSARRNPSWLGAARLVPIDGMLAGVEPTFANRFGQISDRAGIIAVIPFVISRQESPNLMMEIIRPDPIHPPATLSFRLQECVQVAMIFRNQQHVTMPPLTLPSPPAAGGEGIGVRGVRHGVMHRR